MGREGEGREEDRRGDLSSVSNIAWNLYSRSWHSDASLVAKNGVDLHQLIASANLCSISICNINSSPYGHLPNPGLASQPLVFRT